VVDDFLIILKIKKYKTLNIESRRRKRGRYHNITKA
jgi:hypothetical protein